MSQHSGAHVAGSIEAGSSSITKNGLGHAAHEFHDREKHLGIIEIMPILAMPEKNMYDSVFGSIALWLHNGKQW